MSPSTGFVGGPQIVTDLDIDPAGNIWVANDWDLPTKAGFEQVPPEALSTRFGGNGAVLPRNGEAGAHAAHRPAPGAVAWRGRALLMAPTGRE